MRLRPHHLLCGLTWVGKGYSPAFTAGMDAIIRRLAAGETVEIVAGPDDICTPLLREQGAVAHCHGASVTVRDRAAAADLEPLLGSLAVGTRLHLSAADIDRLRVDFRAGSIRRACALCAWSPLCSGLAEAGYPGVRLPGGGSPG
ncbi:DUF1284 domain-containing protein [Oleisolibacter albus]|uniref:DUF1284 domain-containing protein n=1 Tax=Oleisolibacter albus TaxID=2171757 RepID=UPI000DF3C508|nr:DUF1284 domain-containing protein [Oleisolibacter albus]